MLKINKYFSLSIVCLLFCGLLYFTFQIWRSSEESAYMSCLGSVANEIQTLEATKDLIPKDNNWKSLTDNEINFLMQKVQGRDCSNFDNPALDLWNHKINIALRKSSKYPPMIIWSNGADNISGTDDDLVIPFGQTPPK